MKKLYLLLGIIFLFSFTLVSSVQTVIVNSNPQTGLDIFYPQFDSIKANTGFHLHVHTANKSTGLQLNNTVVDCGLQLYNPSGNQTFTKFLIDKDVNGIDHELYIEPGNFSDLGKNSFSIFCNSTGIGGEVEGTFLVTMDGETRQTDVTQAFFLLIFLVIIFGMLGLLMYTIFKMIEWDFDGKDLIYNVSLYFTVFAYYILSKTYLNNVFIDDFLIWLIGIGAFTTVILPIIAFFMNYVKGGLSSNE